MILSSRILGTGVVRQLQERVNIAVLRIGEDAFTRSDLATVQCFNYLAAANLSRILNAEFQVRNTKDVFDNINPWAMALPRLGVISLAVLGAAFEAKRLGGDHPLEAWVTKHRAPEAKREFLTFDTLKHKHTADTKALARERRAQHARQSTRRNRAHRIRVGRYTQRLQGRS